MAEKPKVGAGKYRRENSLAASWGIFLIFFVMFAAGLYVFSFGTLENVWPFAGAILLCSAAFFIPMGIIGRTDTGKDSMVELTRKSSHDGH